MEIKEINVIMAYGAADKSGKQMLRAMFPDIKFDKSSNENRPVTDRIKTLEDACNELGEEHPFVVAYRCIEDIDECGGDIEAFLKLRIIVAALNEGWQPQFTENEWRYYPWFCLWTKEELSQKSEEWKADHHLISTGNYQTEYAGLAYACSADAPSHPDATIGSRLCLKSDTLAIYCGKQFIDIWAEYMLIRK